MEPARFGIGGDVTRLGVCEAGSEVGHDVHKPILRSLD
jgi:hypothetical protein